MDLVSFALILQLKLQLPLVLHSGSGGMLVQAQVVEAMDPFWSRVPSALESWGLFLAAQCARLDARAEVELGVMVYSSSGSNTR